MVEIYASNNVQEMTLNTAYQHFVEPEQRRLQNQMITVLQARHVEQGRFITALGA